MKSNAKNEVMTPEEAAEHRQTLIRMGLLIVDREAKQSLSNTLQAQYDVHAPIEQPDGSRALPSLATQWRLDWQRRCKTNGS